ncbi:pro-neuregulin-1, membrane-bound isoform isoform X11 [Syngnathus scovelli]|uniref:pro-neuregulin-1, membrane-bound isoform isoform X11 n=1 Tax=Syngnathus scovelli TaxID=161590 RepID=UPI0035C9EB0B
MIQPFCCLKLHRQTRQHVPPATAVPGRPILCTSTIAAADVPSQQRHLLRPSTQVIVFRDLHPAVKMTEGVEDFSAGPVPPSGVASPSGSTVDTEQVPEEKPEETEAAGENEEEVAEVTAEGGGDDDDDGGEHPGASGVMALSATCCVCIEMEQINNCLHSEKICILPILACLLSLALCTAGLKWVFADKIFEYEPPTHLDPKRIGQDPIIISVDPTQGLTMSIAYLSPSTVSLTTTAAITSAHPEVLLEDRSTRGSYVPPQGTQPEPSVTVTPTAEFPTIPKQTPLPFTTKEVNDMFIPTLSSTSTTTTGKTSSHVTRCSDSQKNYCVNGGECFTLEIMPGSTKFLCRCPNEFTGDRCQKYVMASFYRKYNTALGPSRAESLHSEKAKSKVVRSVLYSVAHCGLGLMGDESSGWGKFEGESASMGVVLVMGDSVCWWGAVGVCVCVEGAVVFHPVSRPWRSSLAEFSGGSFWHPLVLSPRDLPVNILLQSWTYTVVPHSTVSFLC